MPGRNKVELFEEIRRAFAFEGIRSKYLSPGRITSVVTSKPANGGRVKTGQRMRRPGLGCSTLAPLFCPS